MTNFGYFDGPDLEPLPDWSRFFVDLGAAVANRPDGGLLRIALSLPTLSHAAAFVTLGFTLARARASTPERSREQHLEWLLDLEPGTPVTLRRGTKRLNGIFAGVERIGNVPTFGVRIHSKAGDALTKYLLADDAHLIQPSFASEVKLPKKQQGRSMARLVGFVQHILPDVDPTVYAQSGSVECVIVGQVKRFHEEVTQTRLGLVGGNTIHSGGIHDVIRVERFATDASNPRCQVFAGGRNRKTRPSPNHKRARLALLDGSLPYECWCEEWESTSWIALLARTDPIYPDAEAHVLDAFRSAGRRGILSKARLKVPAGVEVLCDREVKT